jgi:DNA-binding CsgD family transcriptional regulator
LRIAREEQSTRSAALTLECISRILVAAGHHGDAARLSGACREFRTRRGLVRYPCLQRLLDAAEVEARGALGVEVYEAAAAEGATLSIDAAAEYAQRQRVRHTTTRLGWDALTPTEARVAELVAEGLTNPQVARELLMGAETVKTHLSRIFAKVGVGNRRELILAASRRAAERHR